MKYLICILTLAFAMPAGALELRLAPSEGVILNGDAGRGYSDFVLHAIALAAEADETVTVSSLSIDVLQGGAVVESRAIPVSTMVEQTARLKNAGAEATNAQLLHMQGLGGLFGRAVSLSDGAGLAPSTALVATALYFAVPGAPDSVRITATYRSRRRTQSVSTTIPLTPYASPIEYRAPVEGVWVQQALPTLRSHHRLNASTEFATDFFKLNERGELYGGDPLNAETAFGFGAPVLAAADGVVVYVLGDDVQDRDAMMRRSDETPQQAGERIGRGMEARMARDFRRAAAGNLIVIRHASGEVTEYSSYGHLRTHSARVIVGQEVQRGDVIAEVGDTGDSAAVHLHFQVNAGADPFTSQSLPMRFANARGVGGNSELGRFIIAQ